MRKATSSGPAPKLLKDYGGYSLPIPGGMGALAATMDLARREIRAVIRTEKVRDVLDTLENNGHPGVSVEKIEGHGRQTGLVEQFRGREFKIDLLAKARLDIVCPDGDVGALVKLIADIAKTRKIGDGKILSTRESAMPPAFHISGKRPFAASGKPRP